MSRILFFVFKQKTAYEMRISDWSSDVCSSDLLDRPPRRLVGREPRCLHRGGHRLPVGSGAWRRERGGAEHAARNRPPRAHPRIYRPRQGQGRPVPADGLWPPRPQKLRPALDRDAENGRSEEQTPEIQSLMRITDAVLRLKKKKT